MSKSEHVVLYRKYRPQRFADVVGQEHVVGALKNALTLGRVGHAYIFAGTRGTGKTTLARLLGKAVNCENLGSDSEPCNTCQTCIEFSGGRAFDLIEIDAASNRGIDDIRELREAVRFSPMRAKRKVYIVDEVHMLTPPAFNALLKTLEEPPEHAMFILATTELEKVPDTILSRAQVFEFRRLPQEKIRERIQTLLKSEKYKLDEEGTSVITFLADGSLRDAETMLGQLMDAYPDGAGKDAPEKLFGLPKVKYVHALIIAALERQPVRILDTLDAIRKDSIDPKMLSRLLVREARMLLVAALNPTALDTYKKELSEDHAEFFIGQSKRSRKDIEQLLIKLLEAHNMALGGAFQDLPTELALLDATSSSV
ncbi:MAG: DNA polymerase III subunit gamma/tau [Candidatus Ryanbacteria bacterium]|nr:DNA polymerase III subunit gamma/tau [Candidatus Ryanbacteria bacterium]